MRTFEEISPTFIKQMTKYSRDGIKEAAIQYAKEALDDYFQNLNNCGVIPDDNLEYDSSYLLAENWLEISKNNLK